MFLTYERTEPCVVLNFLTSCFDPASRRAGTMPQPFVKHHWPKKLFACVANLEVPQADWLAACANASDGGT